MTAASAAVQQVGDDITNICNHLNRIDVDACFTGILTVLQSPVAEAIGQLRNDLNRAVSIAAAARAGLDESKRYYAETDADEERRQDSLLPGATVPSAIVYEDGRCVVPIAHAHPSRHLPEPPSYEEKMRWKVQLDSDLGSFTGAGRALSLALLDEDPFEPLGEAIVSDWREIRRMADRCRNAANAASDVADNLAACSSDLSAQWTGHASERARAYLMALSEGMRGEAAKAEYVGDKLENLAEGAFGLFNAIVGLVSSSIDGFVAGAISGSFAGGAALAGGPPGWAAGLIGGGYASWRVANAVQEAIEAYQKYGEIKYFVETCAAGFEIVRGGTLQLPGKNTPEIPHDSGGSSFTQAGKG